MAFVFDRVRTFKRQVFSPENVPGKRLFLCVFEGDFGDETYATAGLACDPTVASLWNLSADAIIMGPVVVEPALGAADNPTTGLVLKYDRTNKKILGYTSNGAAPAALAEVNNTNATLFDNLKVRGSCYVMDT